MPACCADYLEAGLSAQKVDTWLGGSMGSGDGDAAPHARDIVDTSPVVASINTTPTTRPLTLSLGAGAIGP